MRWISKDPPLYVWEGDEWYNECNSLIFRSDINSLLWIGPSNELIMMPPKTCIRTKAGWWNENKGLFKVMK